MKDSRIPWVGTIPTTWDVVQLSSIFKEHKDKNKLLEENNLLSLSYGRIIRKDINTKEGLLPQSFDGYNIIQKGDMVFRLTDLQNDKRSLRTGLCKEKGIITSAYITIRKTQELHSDFFHYLLHSYDECKVFYGLGDGVRQGMTFDDLRKLLLVVPPFLLQQQIAKFLDEKCADIDQLIALQQQMIEELKAYKQSVITEAVCKGLDKSVPMKDSGVEWIGEVPESWKIIKVKQLFKVFNGSTPKSDTTEFWGGDITWITPMDMYNKQEICTSIKTITDLGYKSCGTTIIPENSIILSTRAPIGQVSMNKVPLCTNQGCKSLVVKKKSNSRYYFYYFQVQTNVLNMLGRGTTFLELSTTDLSNYILPMPCFNEQNIIVEYLENKTSQIDNLISIKQQKINELKEYKKSMIYEYITGKKQVPND